MSTTSGNMNNTFREQMRRETEEERHLHRQDAVNRVRRNLREVEHDLQAQNVMTAKELAATVAKIKLGNQTSHLDLRALKQALHHSNNSTSFLRITGALSAVISHLTGRRAFHQLEAAYICCNLATGGEYPCESVANAAGPYLLEFLESQNTALIVACLWTLGNLAGGSSKSLKILLSQGIIDRLTNCLRNPHPEVIEAAIYALCLSLKSLITLSCEEKQKLASCAVQLDGCRENVDWLLYLLSCHAECDEILLESMVPQRCFAFLAKLSQDAALQIEDPQVLRSATASLRTVSNLCSEQSGRVALAIISHPSFLTVMNDLVHAKHPHLRQESDWLCQNILNHSTSDIVMKAKTVKLDVIYSVKDIDHVKVKILLNAGAS